MSKTRFIRKSHDAERLLWLLWLFLKIIIFCWGTSERRLRQSLYWPGPDRKYQGESDESDLKMKSEFVKTI